MWRFHLYYIKELVLNMSLTFVMLFGVALLAFIARGIYRSQGVDLLIALWITLLLAIDIVPHLLLIAVLVATVFTFGRASMDNEVIALRMTGISPIRLMGGVIFVGAMAASLNSWLLHDMIPYVHFKKYRPVSDLVKQFVMQQRPTNNTMELGRQLRISWERKVGQRFMNVIFWLVPGSNRRIRIDGFAKEIVINRDVTGRFLIISLEGIKASIFEKGEDGKSHYKGRAESSMDVTKDLREILERDKRWEGLKDTTSVQLLTEIKRDGSPRPGQALWRVWLRSTRAWSTLLIALVGFPIGVLSRRGGRMVAFAISFVPLAIYYSLGFLAPWLARETHSLWPVFIPAGGLLVLAFPLNHLAFRR
ncbi:MAG: LptF/LptG family permease [Planctomycetota bacterium]